MRIIGRCYVVKFITDFVPIPECILYVLVPILPGHISHYFGILLLTSLVNLIVGHEVRGAHHVAL